MSLPFDKLGQVVQRLDVRLCETVVDLYAQLGLTDPRDIYGDLDGMQPYPPGLAPLYRDSQSRGEVLPVYLSWLQLKYIRDRSRRLTAENEFAICALQNRVNYVIGKGFTYKASGDDENLNAQVQEWIDRFTERNEWPEREVEFLWRADRDGEAFLRFFPQDDGVLAVRFIEPEHIKDPAGDAGDPTESFGIETYPLDLETVLNYWVIDNPYQNAIPGRVPAESVLHFKLNVDMAAKRGLPTLYPIEGNLRRAEDLLESMTAMAKMRAKIAMIRKMKGVASDAAQRLIDNTLKSTDATDPMTGQVVSLERIRYGTILNSTDRIDYEFPDSSINAASYVEILQADLRACAARLNMPEWMLTANSNDANYASSLVAEAPSVKSFEHVQRKLARCFGESKRPGSKMSAIWRQIHHAVNLGYLPPEVFDLVDVQVECPTVTARDKAAEAGMYQTYNSMGIISKKYIASQIGVDYDQEKQNLAAEQPAVTPGIGASESPAPEGSPGTGEGGLNL